MKEVLVILLFVFVWWQIHRPLCVDDAKGYVGSKGFAGAKGHKGNKGGQSPRAKIYCGATKLERTESVFVGWEPRLADEQACKDFCEKCHAFSAAFWVPFGEEALKYGIGVADRSYLLCTADCKSQGLEHTKLTRVCDKTEGAAQWYRDLTKSV